MYVELIKALRNMSKMGMKYGMAVVKMREAADAIEELQKRVPKVPHGRLIDADALYDRINAEERMFDKPYIDYRGMVVEAPTIIPAEPFNNLSMSCKDDDDMPICTKASPASLGIYKKAEEVE